MDPGSMIVSAAPEVEQAEVKAPPPAQPEENFGARFAHLAKKERELQKQAETWKKEKETYQSHLKELEDLKKWKAQRESTPEDIGELLASRGLTYDEVINYHLNGGKPDPEALIARTKRELEEKFDRYEQERLERDAKEAETKTQQQQKAFLENIGRYAVENGYELIEANNASELVFETMVQTFHNHGKNLTEKEACDIVEEHLEELELAKFSKLKKLRAKLGIADSEQDPPKAHEQNAQGQSAPTTLNARMTQVGQPQTQKATLNREELNKEAAKHLRWI